MEGLCISYLYDLWREKLKTIKVEQDYLFDVLKHHKTIDRDSFFEIVFQKHLKINDKRMFLVNVTDEDIATSFSCDAIEKIHKRSNKFKYFTANTFNHPRNRSKEKLENLVFLALDFDLAKDGSNRDFTADQLATAIFNELEIFPHFVWKTKTEGNYQAGFLIRAMIGNEKSVYLYEAILKRLAILLGADIAATDATHIFSVPDNVYKYEDSEKVYDMDEFKIVLDNEWINDELAKRRKQYASGVIDFTEQILLRHPAIQKLMNAELIGYRNHACFTLALFLYSLGRTYKDTLAFFEEIWYVKLVENNYAQGFSKREMRKCIKSAFSGKYAGASSEYIELVTGEEFHLAVYRSTYLKKSAEERVYMAKNELRTRLIDWIRKNEDVAVTQKELAELLEVSYRTLKLQIKALKDEGIINVSTSKGRNAKTRLELINNKFVVESYTPSYEAIELKEA